MKGNGRMNWAASRGASKGKDEMDEENAVDSNRLDNMVAQLSRNEDNNCKVGICPYL